MSNTTTPKLTPAQAKAYKEILKTGLLFDGGGHRVSTVRVLAKLGLVELNEWNDGDGTWSAKLPKVTVEVEAPKTEAAIQKLGTKAQELETRKPFQPKGTLRIKKTRGLSRPKKIKAGRK